MIANAPALVCVALLAASAAPDARPRAAQPGGDLVSDTVVMVKESDPEMREAMRRARARLPDFWKALDAGSGRLFSVKVPVTDPAGTEFFWLVEVRRANGRVSGKISNRPNIVRSVTEGQRLEVEEREVVDWMFMRDGKMHGNLTLRPLLKTLPPEQAQALRATFAEP